MGLCVYVCETEDVSIHVAVGALMSSANLFDFKREGVIVVVPINDGSKLADVMSVLVEVILLPV